MIDRIPSFRAVRSLLSLCVAGTLMIGGLLLAAPRASYAGLGQQGGGTLDFGERVSGVLDNDTFRQIYAFDGRANEVVAITMTRVSGDLDPYLLLTSENGDILAISDDDGQSINAEIPFKRLPADGRYFVIATRFGQEHGTTAGEFSLQLERVGSEANENTVFQYGDSIIGRITSEDPVAFYFLRARRGDVINIVMRRTSGDLDPQLEFATAEGIVLVSNDDDPNAEGTLDASINDYLIYESGIYLVVATRFGREAGDTEGSYVLSVAQTPPESLGTTPQNARLLDYGASLSSTLDEEISQRYFQFQARRGDVITATASTTSGNLDALLTLADSTLTPLTSDDNSGNNRDARIAAFTLPAGGTYYLFVSPSTATTTLTSGEFVLELNGRPGVVGGRALEIFYGATVSGQINDQTPLEEYVFFGQQGDRVQITMSRASGDLDSLVTLYDRDRKQIAFDDDSGGEKDALIESFTLPRDDMYILVASRYEREQGTTSGAYILTLDSLD